MTRIIVPAVLAVLLAVPLAAQEAAATRFFIERIEVRNAKRVSAGVVIAESRLREGEEYTESDLSDASARLNRLPFLLSAEFSLERGSERGRHVLVIAINETKPFFYRLDLRPILTDDTYTGLDQASDNISASDTEAFLGYRMFVGRRGAVHVGLQFQEDNREYTEDYGAWAVGYTQYDLFGTRAFATVNLKWMHEGGTITPQIVVGVPLSTNQTLTVAYDDVRIDGDERVVNGIVLNDDEAQRVGSITWSYNTTNQPYLPTRGTRLSVSPIVAWRDDAFFNYSAYSDGTFVVTPVYVHRRSYGVDGSAARYWEITDRSSVSVGGEAGWAKTTDEGQPLTGSFDSTYGILHGGYSWSLWDRDARRDGDNRFELNARVSSRTREELQRRGLVSLRDETNTLMVSGSWVRRSSWGTIRLGLGWAW